MISDKELKQLYILTVSQRIADDLEKMIKHNWTVCLTEFIDNKQIAFTTTCDCKATLILDVNKRTYELYSDIPPPKKGQLLVRDYFTTIFDFCEAYVQEYRKK